VVFFSVLCFHKAHFPQDHLNDSDRLGLNITGMTGFSSILPTILSVSPSGLFSSRRIVKAIFVIKPIRLFSAEGPGKAAPGTGPWKLG
jgi:hypothetical protein